MHALIAWLFGAALLAAATTSLIIALTLASSYHVDIRDKAAECELRGGRIIVTPRGGACLRAGAFLD